MQMLKKKKMQDQEEEEEEEGSHANNTLMIMQAVPSIPCSSSVQVVPAPASAAAKQVILVAFKATANSDDSICISVRWVLDELARPGDMVVILAALHPSTFNLASDMFGSKLNGKKVYDKVEGRRKELEMILSSLYVDSLQKKVKFCLDVRRGKIKALGIGHAMMLKATHIVLARELKLYKQHFVEHLPCMVIQMRRKTLAPLKLQGVQSSVMPDSYESDFDDLLSCSASQLSSSESPPHVLGNHEIPHILSMNTELFSIDMAKQPLDNLAETPESGYGELAILRGACHVVINGGSDLLQASSSQQAALSTNDLAGTIRRVETMLSTSSEATGKDCSSICSMDQELPCDRSMASSSLSRASSFRNLPRQCNNVESLILESHLQEVENASSATKDGSLQIVTTKPLALESQMQELDTTLAAKDGLFEIDPIEIQENVKEIISVQCPSKKHAPQPVDTLLIEEGLSFDGYLVFGEQGQGTAEYDSSQAFRHHAYGDARKIRTIKESSIVDSEVIQYVVSTDDCSITLHPVEDYYFMGEESCESSVVPCSFCSVCEQSPLNLGKRPINFSYVQLVLATNGFSRENLLGGDDAGLVYKGMLEDGLHITVKKFKEPCISENDDRLFEAQLLMCAQHRNLVMLLGYCSEDDHFLLVNEYTCNKSLSWHLAKEHNPDGLQWWARRKIAIGVARALRYLHEECRGGCIIHQNLRADNIFLTHEFVPMVGNFGLAYWRHDNLDSDAGQEVFSWRSDVYAFGVLLLELITGKQALDNSNTESEQQNLVGWAQPLLLDGRYYELLDSRLENSHDSFELICVVRAALICIRDDPSSRPRMSKVMYILEGAIPIDDEPGPMIEHSLSEELLMQSKQKNESEPKPQSEGKPEPQNGAKPKPEQLQHVASNKKKKPKQRLLTYKDMLD